MGLIQSKKIEQSQQFQFFQFSNSNEGEIIIVPVANVTNIKYTGKNNKWIISYAIEYTKIIGAHVYNFKPCHFDF